MIRYQSALVKNLRGLAMVYDSELNLGFMSASLERIIPEVMISLVKPETMAA